MKTRVHLWYVPDLFLEYEMFQTKVVKEVKTHFIFNTFFFKKSCRLWDNVEKMWYSQTGLILQYDTAHAVRMPVT